MEVEHNNLDSEIETTKTKPMTYFLYPTLDASELKTFLEENRASDACVQKALADVRVVNPNTPPLAVDADETSLEDNRCRSHLSARTEVDASRLSEADSTNISLDWFDDTYEVSKCTHTCSDDKSVIMNSGRRDGSNNVKNHKYTSVNFENKKRNRFLGFLTSMLRQTREQLIPKCMSRKAMPLG
ncbi:uncharacterized protein LOC121366607 [Gigantopelta aegis]|uniref:uncharacterized protein LOC121366607 n=1 Tax=Gigantopelta aegis TaxID=1735272 RepID=UPI001B888ADB|nr:uncharacterized protein LOC121366607 [Gigantopelta aegis]